MAIRKLIVIFICLGLCGCSSLMNRMPNPVIQEKDMIYEVRPGTTLDLYYGGKQIPTTLNESRYLVTEDLLISMASDNVTKILKKVKVKKDRNKILILIGSILAILASIAGLLLTGKIKSLIPKKITTTIGDK